MKINLIKLILHNFERKFLTCILLIRNKEIVKMVIEKLFSINDVDLTRYICEIRLHEMSINHLIQLSNGNIATCSKDKTIKIFNANFENLFTLKGHSEDIWNITELRNNLLASCSLDCTIRLWDGNENYSNTRTIAEPKNPIYYITTLRFGLLAAALKSATVKVYNPDTEFSCIYTLDSSVTSLVTVLLQLADGRLGVGCSYSLILWDYPEAGDNYIRLLGHRSPIIHLIQLRNRNLATTSLDHTIRIWDYEKGFEVIAILMGNSDEVSDSLIERNDGSIVTTKSDHYRLIVTTWMYKRDGNYQRNEETYEHYFDRKVFFCLYKTAYRRYYCVIDNKIRILE
jgi:WD40 repeat protein